MRLNFSYLTVFQKQIILQLGSQAWPSISVHSLYLGALGSNDVELASPSGIETGENLEEDVKDFFTGGYEEFFAHISLYTDRFCQGVVRAWKNINASCPRTSTPKSREVAVDRTTLGA